MSASNFCQSLPTTSFARLCVLEKRRGLKRRQLREYSRLEKLTCQYPTQVTMLNNAELKLMYERVMRALYAKDIGSSSDTWRFIAKFTEAMTKQQKSYSPLQWKIKLKLN
jgi:hypothetical protein